MEQLKPEEIVTPIMAWEKRKRELFVEMIMVTINKNEPRGDREKAIDYLFNGDNTRYYDELIEAGILLLRSVRAAQ